MSRLPDFFIVGAPKAGTTSLYHYLKKHPEVFMCPIKEPNFFSFEEIEKQGLYYKTENIKTLKLYRQLFKQAKSGQILGEASVSYLFYPSVPFKIKALIPGAKIIILLRNPVERAFSHYLMDLKMGYVNLNFERIVKKDVYHRFASLYYQQYVRLGFYFEQVKRYLDVFGSENVLVLITEEMEKHSEKVFVEVCNFLEISERKGMLFERYNVYREPSFSFVGKIYSQHFLRKIAKKIIPFSGIRRKISGFLFPKRERPEIPDSVRDYLINLYQEDIMRLESLISKNLSCWYG